MTESKSAGVKSGKTVILLVLLLLGISLTLFLLMRSGKLQKTVSGPRIYLTGAETTAGGEFYVDVNVAENPGFAGIVLEMNYDGDTMTPLEVQNGSLTDEGLIDSNFGNGSLKMTWFDVEDISGDGGLFVVKFRAAGTARSGITSPVTLAYNQGDVSNMMYQDVDFSLVSADVKIR